MKPVSPVFEGIDEVVYAKDQPQYQPLPAVKCSDGVVITRWRMTLWERIEVLFKGNVYLQLSTFRKPLQPVMLSVEPPMFSAGVVPETDYSHLWNKPAQKLTAE